MNNYAAQSSSFVHTKPMCAHFYEKLADHKTLVLREEAQQPANFQGTYSIKKLCLFTAGSINLVAATINCAIAAIFATLVGSLHYITRGKSITLHKITLKFVADVIHNDQIIKAQAKLMFKNDKSPSHAYDATLTYAMHFRAVMRSQGYGQMFNKMAGRANEPLGNVLSRQDWSFAFTDVGNIGSLTVEKKYLSEDIQKFVKAISKKNPAKFEHMPEAKAYEKTLQNYSIANLKKPEFAKQVIKLAVDWRQFVVQTEFENLKNAIALPVTVGKTESRELKEA